LTLGIKPGVLSREVDAFGDGVLAVASKNENSAGLD
jgi:hypothetical protein